MSARTELPRGLVERHVVILRDRVTRGRTFRGAFAGWSPEYDDGLRVASVDIDRREAHKLLAGEDVVGIAPVMPMRLIDSVEDPVARVPVHPQLTESAAPPSASWGLEAIGVPETELTGRGITVAVLDSGIERGHEAFRHLEIDERDFTGEGNGDTSGHGTHCAGIIAGGPVDGMRIGVAPGIARLLVGKVIDRDRGGDTLRLTQAMRWAAMAGAHVISMSLSLDFTRYVEQGVERHRLPKDIATLRALDAYLQTVRLIEEVIALIAPSGAFPQATVIVAAAGGQSRRGVDPTYEASVVAPGCARGVISVGAVREQGGWLSVMEDSNTGPTLCAPGRSIVSAKRGGGLAPRSGTSVATPHVAGAASLWAEKLMRSGQLTTQELERRVTGSVSVDRLQAPYDPTDVGCGIVQVPLR